MLPCEVSWRHSARSIQLPGLLLPIVPTSLLRRGSLQSSWPGRRRRIMALGKSWPGSEMSLNGSRSSMLSVLLPLPQQIGFHPPPSPRALQALSVKCQDHPGLMFLLAISPLQAVLLPPTMMSSATCRSMPSRKGRSIARSHQPSGLCQSHPRPDFLLSHACQLLTKVFPGAGGSPLPDLRLYVVFCILYCFAVMTSPLDQQKRPASAVPKPSTSPPRPGRPPLRPGGTSQRPRLALEGIDRPSGGVCVHRVIRHGAADRAGIHNGDVITGANKGPINTLDELTALVQSVPLSQPLTLAVERLNKRGQKLAMTIVVNMGVPSCLQF